MKCQPIAPNGNIVSFKLIRKNPENKNLKPDENTGFKIVYNGDTFEFTKIPQEGGILDNDNNR